MRTTIIIHPENGPDLHMKAEAAQSAFFASCNIHEPLFIDDKVMRIRDRRTYLHTRTGTVEVHLYGRYV